MSNDTATDKTRIFSGDLHRLRRGNGYRFTDRAPVTKAPVRKPK